MQQNHSSPENDSVSTDLLLKADNVSAHLCAQQKILMSLHDFIWCIHQMHCFKLYCAQDTVVSVITVTFLLCFSHVTTMHNTTSLYTIH